MWKCQERDGEQASTCSIASPHNLKTAQTLIRRGLNNENGQFGVGIISYLIYLMNVSLSDMCSTMCSWTERWWTIRKGTNSEFFAVDRLRVQQRGPLEYHLRNWSAMAYTYVAPALGTWTSTTKTPHTNTLSHQLVALCKL
jgi:hypothetical protein